MTQAIGAGIGFALGSAFFALAINAVEKVISSLRAKK